MQLRSNHFDQSGGIPAKYTCDGDNINPHLEISDAPEDAQSLVLLVDDPDAATDPDGPGRTFDHWIVFNINPATTAIEENSTPEGATVGVNGSGQSRYTGPCPPNGTHRYYFRICALDTTLDLPEGATKQEVESAMEGHLLDQAELMGVYQKQG